MGGVIIFKSSKILAVFVSVITLLCCINSYAANIDYLNAVNWSDNKHVSSANIEKKSANDIMYGEIRYIKDNDNLTIYTYFSVSETSLLYDYSDDVRVIYEVEAAEADYNFTINSEGIEDEFGQSEEIFDCGSNIYYEASALQVLTYAQYTGKSTEIKVRVYIAVNSSRYLALDSVKLKVPETTTKNKRTTTKKAPAGKSAKHTKTNPNKSDYVTTTKFRFSDSDDEFVSEVSSSNGKNSEINEDVYSRGELPQKAKILLIVGVVLLLLGIAIAAFYAGKSTNSDENEDDNTIEQ